jgi:hypothetical protein
MGSGTSREAQNQKGQYDSLLTKDFDELERCRETDSSSDLQPGFPADENRTKKMQHRSDSGQIAKEGDETPRATASRLFGLGKYACWRLMCARRI